MSSPARPFAAGSRTYRHDPTTRRFWTMLIAAAACTVAVAAFTASQPRTPLARGVGDLAILVAALLAFAGCAAAARRVGPAARAWWALTVAFVVWSAGMGLFAWYGLTREVAPFPSLADAGFLGYSIPAVIGLLLFPRVGHREFLNTRVILDALAIATAVLLISWAGVLGPLVDAGGSGLSRVPGAGYPIVDLVVASVVLSVGMRGPAGSRLTWLVLGSGLLLIVVTDSLYVLALTKGETDLTSTPLAASWVLGLLLVAISGHTPDRPVAVGQVQPFSVVQELVPYVPAFVAMLVTGATNMAAADPFLVVSAIIAFVVFVIREVVVVVEKVQLAKRPGAHGRGAYGGPERRTTGGPGLVAGQV